MATGPLKPSNPTPSQLPSWEFVVESVYKPEPRGILRGAQRTNPWAIAFRAEHPAAGPEPTIDTVIHPAPKPAAKAVTPAPARLPYSHPSRKADRVIQKAKAKVQHAEQVAKYVAQGLDEGEAERRVRQDTYMASINA